MKQRIRRTVRLSRLIKPGEPPILDGWVFKNCVIQGPAVLMPTGRVVLQGNSFGGKEWSFIWPVPDEKVANGVTGAIGISDCEFYNCIFESVGLAVPRSWLPKIRMGFNNNDPEGDETLAEAFGAPITIGQNVSLS